jgi:hypothetical protein
MSMPITAAMAAKVRDRGEGASLAEQLPLHDQ